MDMSSTTTEEGKTLQQVPCCVCGCMILPNEACLCLVCLQRETSMHNSKEDSNELPQCRGCNRWCSHIGKDTWVHHDLESAGLLGLCIKKLGAVSKAKVLDAGWIWTEPHSRRLKLFVDVEMAVLDGKMKVQQRVVADFVLKSKQCPDCMRSESDHTWGAMIQLRQRINHQRSLVVLEAQLTKAGMHNLMIGVENAKQGMNFFFKQKNQAEKVVNFISSHLPVKSKFSKKHISTDPHTSKPRFELTFSVDVVPLGRGDLVLMPVNLNAKNSSAGELILVSKVASSVHLINPVTLKRDELTANRYFAKEKLIRVLMSPAELVRFVILDIEPVDMANKSVEDDGEEVAKPHRSGKESGGFLADAEVARESDLGSNDTTYRVRTHLGHLLRAGDVALGYDMARFASSAAIEDNAWLHHMCKGRDKNSTVHVPDVILVKKDFDETSKKKKPVRQRRRRHARKSGAEEGGEIESVGEDVESVFSLSSNVEEQMDGLSVVDEEEDEEEEDEEEGDFLADSEVADGGDLEGLFSHLVGSGV